MKLMLAVAFGIFILYVSADDVSEEVFGTYTSFYPAAFGDFNSDKHTDIFILKTNKTTGTCFAQVLLANQDPPLLRPGGPNCSCPGGSVSSIVPGDFDGDGALDVLMLNKKSYDMYDVYIGWGNTKNVTCPTEKILTVHGEPLMMDYNGDMIADLFGEDENKTRNFWVFNSARSAPLAIEMGHKADETLPPIRVPSSHGFVDLDGDLGADLFVTATDRLEIWKNTQQGFILKEHIKIPDWVKVIGQTAFMDISLSGKTEPVTVLCGESDCSDGQVYVWGESLKNNEKKLLAVGPSLKIDSKTYKYPTDQSTHLMYMDTITLRVADHDLDGYPDLLLTLLDSSGNPQVFLAHNTPCTDKSCPYSRKFDLTPELFKDYPNSIVATFFDVFEDGRVDILLVYEDKKNKGHYVTAALTDPQQYDAMFLKVLVPSGRCYSECAYHNMPYGTSPAGPTFRYTITTGDKGIQTSVATQLSQSAHMALQLPYTLFGLGRNWNFVETLEVALPIKMGHNNPFRSYSNRSDITDLPIMDPLFPSIRNFTQIIPNSQVIVIPYPLSDPDRWVNKLYITPSKALKLTAAALVGVCTLVACIIAVLHYQEKKEDKKEKLQQAQTFHFDAM